MGGCSSKPKTADFEGVLGLQEEEPQEEASKKNLNSENTVCKGIERQSEVCELPIQTQLAEKTKGQGETQDVRTLPEKQMIESFKGETPIYQDDCQDVKHVLEETTQDSGVKKELPSNQESLEVLQIAPKTLASKVSEGHDDSVLIIDFSNKSQEDMSLLAAHDAETVDVQCKLLTLSNGNLGNEGILTLSNGHLENGIDKGVFSDSDTLSLQDALNVELKSMHLQNGYLELPKDHLCIEGAEALELQKGSMDSGHSYLGLEEEARKIEVKLDHHNTVKENREQSCDEHVTSLEEDKHLEERIGEGKALCKESEDGACEVVRTSSDDILVLESERDSKDHSKRIVEGMSTGAACKEVGEDFIIGCTNDTKSAVAEASDHESAREFPCMGDCHPSVIADAIQVILQRVVDEKTEERGADADAAASKSSESFVKILNKPEKAPIEDKLAVKDVLPRADSHLVNDVHVKESGIELLDTANGEGEFVSRKNCCFSDNHISQPVVVGEEPSQLKLETSREDAQEKKPCAVALDLEGQHRSDGAPIPNGVTAFQVLAVAKKPKAQCVSAIDFTELAFIPAQDIPAPDIDEVLEKLASEFERQERVARATP